MAPVVAPAPERASGLAAPGLLAWLLICKFADALPFYRQEAIFRERHRVFITRQQMVQWMKQGTALLEGIWIARHTLSTIGTNQAVAIALDQGGNIVVGGHGTSTNGDFDYVVE